MSSSASSSTRGVSRAPAREHPISPRRLERIRHAELESVRAHFKPGLRVLEIGGGSGYQASIIDSWGCNIVALDLGDRSSEQARYYPVQEYDGARIPFPGASFDLVFSSNVLEHVGDLKPLCREMHRVLVPGGVALHILPTPAWRWWTIVAHYPYLLKRFAGRGEVGAAVRLPSANEVLKRRGLRYMLGMALFASAHGEYPNAISELYYYSNRRWTRFFRESGFEIVASHDAGVFHTGYALLPGLSIRVRRLLGRVLGSACRAFVLRPRDGG